MTIITGILISSAVAVASIIAVYSNKMKETISQIFVLLIPTITTIIMIVSIIMETIDVGDIPKYYSFALVLPAILSFSFGLFGLLLVIIYWRVH